MSSFDHLEERQERANYCGSTDYSYVTNDVPIRYSVIEAIGLVKNDPTPIMNIVIREGSKTEYLLVGDTLIGPRVAEFYRKCLTESRKVKGQDPRYVLSNRVLRKIKDHYQSRFFPPPPHLKVTQTDINLLYQRYHKEIMNAALTMTKGESLVILAGEGHHISLLQNLTAFNIAKDTEKLTYIFLEGHEESFLKSVQEKHILDSLESIRYLYFLAKSLEIPVKCIEDKEAREQYLAAKSEKKDTKDFIVKRDFAMANNIKLHLSKGIGFVLCGADHIPELVAQLKNHYKILVLDYRNFQIESSPSHHGKSEKKLVSFERDNLEIYEAVLAAKSSCTKKTGTLDLLEVPDEVEYIDSYLVNAAIKREIKAGAAYIPGTADKALESSCRFFPRSKSFSKKEEAENPSSVKHMLRNRSSSC